MSPARPSDSAAIAEMCQWHPLMLPLHVAHLVTRDPDGPVVPGRWGDHKNILEDCWRPQAG